MTRPVGLRDPLSFAGRVELHALESEALRGNALGDPHVREVCVYLPPGAGSGARLPVLLVLAALTSRAHAMLETHPWKLGPVARYDAAVARGEAAPAVLVLPDCFTRLGGSQYVNSSATGRYEDFVVREVLPFADERLPVLPGARGVLGKSSGGFGALHLAMRHPGLFRACASVSGDCCFEHCFGSELLPALRGLVAHGMDPARFLAAFERDHELAGDAHAVLNVLCMSACYSPNPASPLGFDLPVDLDTGERREDVWRRWQAFDPVRACAEHRDALRALDWLHLECGMADQFHLQWGLRVLVRRLTELGIPFHHEEHPGSHFGLDARLPDLFARMAARLAA